MGDLLRNFQLDQPSFWLGFLAGSLIWFIFTRLRGIWQVARQKMQANAALARQLQAASVEVRHGNDTIKMVQGLHLAAPLFSLDEIVIPPRLLPPPPAPEPGVSLQWLDITEEVLPYTPDWPELAGYYKSPSLSPFEALHGRANLAFIGPPGSGKTTALAYLACQVVRGPRPADGSENPVPFFLHYAALNLLQKADADPLDPILEAILPYASSQILLKLPEFIRTTFQERRAVLLIDGMDELLPADIEIAVQFLQKLSSLYPGNQVVITMLPTYFHDILSLGFVPLALLPWDEEQRKLFSDRWNELWNQYILQSQPPEPSEDFPNLLSGWLQGDSKPVWPFYLTLQIWAARAGDALGPSIDQAIEAYLRRMTDSRPLANFPKARLALEQLASQILLTMQPILSRKEVQTWGEKWEPERAASVDSESATPIIASLDPSTPLAEPDATTISPGRPQATHQVALPRVLPALMEAGLIRTYQSDRFSLAHPIFMGYLAAQSLQGVSLEGISAQPAWCGKLVTQEFLAHHPNTLLSASDWVRPIEDDPLQMALFQAARWLSGAPENIAWRSTILRQLASVLKNESLPLGLRARAVTALVLSKSQGINTLLKQSLNSQDPEERLLSALGLGVLRDGKTTLEVVGLLSDPIPKVQRAACLALVAIGNKNSLEAVADALLQGSQDLRQAAAQSLANHPEEGYPALLDGSSMEDVSVRRAVVFGLRRVNKPWAVQELEKMRADDPQWVVKNAASQALDDLSQENVHTPHSPAPPEQTGWVIAFAGEHGMGVSPGKPAQDLVLLAAREGNLDQRLAAFHYIGAVGLKSAIQIVAQAYFSNEKEIREAALNALWNLVASGSTVPNAVQYGFRS